MVVYETCWLPRIGNFYRSLFGFGTGGTASPEDLFYLKNYALVLIVGAVGCTPLAKKLYDRLPEPIRSCLTVVLIAAVLVLSTAYLVDSTYNPFLYFRF